MVFKSIFSFIGNQPILRLVLVVMSIAFLIKQKMIYDSRPKIEVDPNLIYQETEEQKQNSKDRKFTGIVLSFVLFCLFVLIKRTNLKAEKIEEEAKLAAKEKVRQEREDWEQNALRLKKEREALNNNKEIEGVKEWCSEDEKNDKDD